LRCDPTRVMASSFLRFLDHTQRRTTVGRTPLDELLARCRDLYLTTHNTHNRQTSMLPVGFEPTISADERPQTYALDRAASGTGNASFILEQNPTLLQFELRNLTHWYTELDDCSTFLVQLLCRLRHVKDWLTIEMVQLLHMRCSGSIYCFPMSLVVTVRCGVIDTESAIKFRMRRFIM